MNQENDICQKIIPLLAFSFEQRANENPLHLEADFKYHDTCPCFVNMINGHCRPALELPCSTAQVTRIQILGEIVICSKDSFFEQFGGKPPFSRFQNLTGEQHARTRLRENNLRQKPTQMGGGGVKSMTWCIEVSGTTLQGLDQDVPN